MDIRTDVRFTTHHASANKFQGGCSASQPEAVQFGAIKGKAVPGVGESIRFVKTKDRGGQGIADDDVVIVAASRTPLGKQGGALANVGATALAYVTGKATLAQSGVKPELVEKCVAGSVVPNDLGAAYLPRTVGLLLGMKNGSTSRIESRRCASGFSAVEAAAKDVANGLNNAVLAVGTENMSMSPLSHFTLPLKLGALQARMKQVMAIADEAQRNAAIGQLAADFEGTWKPQGMNPPAGFEFTLQGGLTDPLKDEIMFKTADRLAKEHGLTRPELEELSMESNRRALKAQAEGRFKAELAPVRQSDLDEVNAHLKVKASLPTGVNEVSQDEGPREPNAEKLAKLSVLDRKNPDAVHTAASASQITDGAASVLITSGKFAKANGLKVLAKIRSIGNAGVRPEVMGYGPVPAMKLALEADGWKTAKKMDLVEVNEAFAAVAEVAIRELNLDRSKVNVNGSGISLGHPIGATGARLVTHLAHELNRQNKQFGIAAACIGGGEGAAIVLENVNYAEGASQTTNTPPTEQAGNGPDKNCWDPREISKGKL